ncbi:hypothetical protein [Sphingobium amiense]|uniref:hypothetical protein n=1 Tax=Sphingobium amiense TaxID=135719 RepID=UPI00083176CF|nr:hypothetical protein [Sphingobium amiense]
MTDSTISSADEPAEGDRGTPPPGANSPQSDEHEQQDESDANLPPEKINPLAPPVNVQPGS